jgi:hypothetical protein
MTSQTIPEFTQQDLEGRSVRDVVAYSPEQVDDAWCRKILRKILQSLELQYAMQMPHRAITLDTVVFHANGEPFLLSDDIDAAPAPDTYLADDLAALAGVIHYAITQEFTPTGPLSGRANGYSGALVATVDACMDPDPARRPRSIDAVRGLLGMAASAPLSPSMPSMPSTTAAPPAIPPASTPAPVAPAIPEAAVETPRAGMRRGQRWAMAGGGALAAALVLFVTLRDTGSTKPPTNQVARSSMPAQGDTAPVGTAVADARMDQAATGASGASSGGATGSSGDEPDGTADVAPNPANAADSVAATVPPARPASTAAAAPAMRKAAADKRPAAPPAAVAGNANYQLQIKPWGNVFVDGVDHGVSPPLRRLTLKPGPHTIRITHPHYRESILEFESAATTSNGKIIVDFNREAQ